MPSLQGIRRRGYTPSALKLFVSRLGLSKQNSMIDFSVLENTLARRPRRARTAPHGGARAAEVRADEPARRPRRNAALLQSSEGRNAGRARDSVLARAVDRAATTSPKCRRRAGSAWCPAAKCACAARASCACDEVIKDADGNVVELRGCARSRIAPRHGRRRPQGEGHDPLGQRAACGARGSAPVRPPVLRAGSGRRHRRQDLSRSPQPGVAHRRARVRRTGRRARRAGTELPVRAPRVTSSPIAATIAATRRSSIAASRCATPGRRKA